jgi:hypothetical protein
MPNATFLTILLLRLVLVPPKVFSALGLQSVLKPLCQTYSVKSTQIQSEAR